MNEDLSLSSQEADSLKFSKNRGFRYLITLCLQERGLFGVSLIALLGATASNLIFPLVIKAGVDETWGLSLRSEPRTFLSIIVFLFFIQGSFFFLRSYLFGRFGQRITFNLRCATFRTFLMQPPSRLDQERVSDLVSRLSNDTILIQDALSSRLSVLIRYILQGMAGIAFMMWLSPLLTVLILFIVPVLLALSLGLGRQLKSLTKSSQAALGDVSSIAEEALSNLKIVKAFTAEDAILKRFSVGATSVLNLGIKRVRVSALLQSFIPFLLNVALAVFLLVGISFLNSNKLTLGDLTSFIIYASIVAVSVSFVMGGLSEFFQSLAAVDRVTELSHYPEENYQKTGRLPRQEIADQAISFRMVNFSYPSRPEIPVLKNVTFTLPTGKTTALIGESGGGKSTVAELLMDFYRPSSGAICWGENTFSELAPQELRQHIAYVPQDPMLFGVSLSENLRIASPDASDNELYDILSVVNLADFVDSLPNGLNTLVGEKGVQLSGGQKQRVALARALLRKPLLLILDEATSALDSTNERIVWEAITKHSNNVTVLVITHRLSSVSSADQLLVLDNGTIAETGTPQSLQARGGLYSQFASQQGLHG
jgi:ABC-type multidrug transport system fused ATPase/permease subunit